MKLIGRSRANARFTSGLFCAGQPIAANCRFALSRCAFQQPLVRAPRLQKRMRRT